MSNNNNNDSSSVIKNAYSNWLDDLLDGTNNKNNRPAKKKYGAKKQRKKCLKKSKSAHELIQQERVTIQQQGLKPKPKRKRLIPIPTETTEQIRARQFNKLRSQVSFKTAGSNSSNLKPGPEFFKWLNVPNFWNTSRTNGDSLRIPPTLIKVQDQEFLWITAPGASSDDASFDFRTYNSNSSIAFAKKLRKIRQCFQNKRAIVKVGGGQRAELVSSVSTDEVIEENHIMMMQKYIKPKGANAWIARVVYSRKNSPVVWILTTRNSEIVDLRTGHERSAIVKSASSTTSWNAPKTLVQSLVVALESQHSPLIFQEFCADLVMDCDSNWWLLQVKHFKLKQRLSGRTSLNNTSQNVLKGAKCPGSFCNNTPPNGAVNQLQPNLHLTHKDMLKCHYTKSFDEDESTSGFSKGLDAYLATISRKERNRLYDRVSICNNCEAEYSRLLKLCDKMLLAKGEKASAEVTEIEEDEEPEEQRTTLDDDIIDLEAMFHLELAAQQRLVEASTTASTITLSEEEEEENNDDIVDLEEEADDFLPITKSAVDDGTGLLRQIAASIPEKGAVPVDSLAEKLEVTLNQPLSKDRTSIDEQLRLIEERRSASKSLFSTKTSGTEDIWKKHAPTTIKEQKKNDNTIIQSSSYLPVNTVTIDSCESIFFNDVYKDEIVEKAQQGLSMSHKVRLVIPSGSTMDFASQQMVLRTLHLELQTSSSDYKLPEISKDQDGNTTMLVAPY